MAFTQKKMTLARTISLVMICLCLFMLFMPWLGSSIREMGISAVLGVNAFKTSVGGYYTSFWSVMLIICSILFILCVGLAVFGLVTERNLLVLPVAVLAFGMFFLALFQLIFIDSSIHMTYGSWFFLIFGIGAYVFALLDDLGAGRKPFDFSRIGIVPKPKAPRGPRYSTQAAAGWQCPTCGAFQGMEQNFCDRCGTRKPEPARCPACGTPAKPGELFCANCGTRL